MLQFMLVPGLLKPLVYAIVRTFPIPVLAQLNRCRCQLYMASLMLAKNSMERLGMKVKDDLGMYKAFGEPAWGQGRGGGSRLHSTAWGPCSRTPCCCAARHTAPGLYAPGIYAAAEARHGTCMTCALGCPASDCAAQAQASTHWCSGQCMWHAHWVA
jgi:hypothetical protein